jgi:hypothetical protein
MQAPIEQEDKSPYITAQTLMRVISFRVAAYSLWFLAPGFFYPEDEGDTFLRNVGSHKYYTVTHPRRRLSSNVCLFYISVIFQHHMLSIAD